MTLIEAREHHREVKRLCRDGVAKRRQQVGAARYRDKVFRREGDSRCHREAIRS